MMNAVFICISDGVLWVLEYDASALPLLDIVEGGLCLSIFRVEINAHV
jgi:hypothetical protein